LKPVSIALSAVAGSTVLVVFYAPIMTFLALLTTYIVAGLKTPLQHEVMRDFRMSIESTANIMPGRSADPILLAFEGNPTTGIIVDRTQIHSLPPDARVVTARLHIWGYRFQGVIGYKLVSITGEPYSGFATTHGFSRQISESF
jgi:hypothetical protein